MIDYKLDNSECHPSLCTSVLCDQVSGLQCCLGRVEPLREGCADKLG